ncbi:MAG: HIT family protein [Candidatus Bathyarchaeota archaeon]|jgi:histidine triad (HIT) family protein
MMIEGSGSLLENCTFCKIVRRELPTSQVYEDEKTMAFLDIRPINEGHTLVIPKKHYKNIHEIPDEELEQLFKIVKKIATAVKQSIDADGISIFQNNGSAAGQVVFHIHVHVIPRYHGQRTQHREEKSRQELEKIAEKLREGLIQTS